MSSLSQFTPEQKVRYAEELVDRLDLRVTVEALQKLLARMPSRASLRRSLAAYPTRAALRQLYLDAESQEEREDVRATVREWKELRRLLDERIVTEAALRDAKDRLATDVPLIPAELKIVADYEARPFTYQPPPPRVPTLTEPGPDKVAVLERRAGGGQGLWHAGDAKLSADDGCEYDPVIADGNFQTVGRELRTPKATLPGKGRFRERLP